MVHAVLMRGVNDHEAAGLLRFCLDRGYELRFIEQMPLDAQHGWRRTDMITASEILARLSDGFSLTPDDPRGRGSAPAEMFLVRRRPRPRRRDRLGHPTVLRIMRPGPADRGPAGPQPPVRHDRDRPAHPAPPSVEAYCVRSQCRSWPPPGEARTCPATCGHKARWPDAITTPGPSAYDLAPQFAPQRHWTPDGGRPQAWPKEPVREAMAEIFRPTGTVPLPSGNDTPALIWDLIYGLNARPSPCTGRGPRIGRRKNPPDLRSPLTESNRRPSPYHGPPEGRCKRRRSSEQAER